MLTRIKLELRNPDARFDDYPHLKIPLGFHWRWCWMPGRARLELILRLWYSIQGKLDIPTPRRIVALAEYSYLPLEEQAYKLIDRLSGPALVDAVRILEAITAYHRAPQADVRLSLARVHFPKVRPPISLDLDD